MTQLIDQSLAAQFDRLPPSAIDAEMCVIASMMLDRTCIPLVMQIIGRDAFAQADHQILFDVLVKLNEDGIAIDTVILRGELAKMQLLDEVGGTAYLAQLLSTVPSASHAEYYARIVREKFLLRSFIGFANGLLRKAYGPMSDSAEEVGQQAMTELAAILTAQKGHETASLRSLAQAAYWDLESNEECRTSLGFASLDSAGISVGAGETMIIGPRPSMGKSILAKQIALNVGRMSPVVLCSTEESGRKIARNILSNMATVENGVMQRIAGAFTKRLESAVPRRRRSGRCQRQRDR